MDDRSPGIVQSAIFEDVPDEAVEQLCLQGRLETFDAGQMLFERGLGAEDLMILRDGVVELLFPVEIMGVMRDVTMESKQAGDVVAWSSLVRPYQFTLSARCATHCAVASFSRHALQAFFELDPRTGYLVMRNLAGVIGRRLQAMQSFWMHDLQGSTRKRLG